MGCDENDAKRNISLRINIIISLANKQEWLIMNSFNILIKNRGEQLTSSGPPFLRTKLSVATSHDTI